MEKEEINEKIKKVEEERKKFVEQYNQLTQNVDIVKTNIIRLDGIISFLKNELKNLKDTKTEVKNE